MLLNSHHWESLLKFWPYLNLDKTFALQRKRLDTFALGMTSNVVKPRLNVLHCCTTFVYDNAGHVAKLHLTSFQLAVTS